MVAPTASFLATGKIPRTREGYASRAAADTLVKSQQGWGWDGGSSGHHGTLWDIARHSVCAAQISFCGKEPPWNPLGHRKTQCFRGPDKFLWKRVTMEP